MVAGVSLDGHECVRHELTAELFVLARKIIRAG